MKEPAQYQLITSEVEAMQYTGDNLTEFITFAAPCAPTTTRKVNHEGHPQYIILEARQRMATHDDMVPLGMWLLKLAPFRYQVLSDDNFTSTYAVKE